MDGNLSGLLRKIELLKINLLLYNVMIVHYVVTYDFLLSHSSSASLQS